MSDVWATFERRLSIQGENEPVGKCWSMARQGDSVTRDTTSKTTSTSTMIKPLTSEQIMENNEEVSEHLIVATSPTTTTKTQKI